ncbi:MAG: nucleotidyltransferase domain-containing protein, partial [Euryarchaeota archaeon]|nr:nucleotidyltransferase domain-containing protein [Euryarchaeota archaeon]
MKAQEKEQAIKEFIRKVREDHGDRVEKIILYGS